MKAHWRGKSITWGKRLVLVILILGAACYGVLSLAERSKEQIRLGLEDYLSNATGQSAEITDLVTVKLTPNIVFRVKDIIVRDKADKGKSLVKAENAYISIPLWHLFLGIRRYLGFEVQGLETATGFFLPKKLTLGFAGISDPSGGAKAPHFMAEGKYNGQDLLFTAEMLRKDRGKKPPYYMFDDSFRVTTKLGALEGDGIFVRNFTSVAIDDAHVRRGGFTAVFDVTEITQDPAHALAEGTINAVPFNAELTPHLVTVKPASAKAEDIKTVTEFFAAVAKDLGVENSPEILKFDIVTPETDVKE